MNQILNILAPLFMLAFVAFNIYRYRQVKDLTPENKRTFIICTVISIVMAIVILLSVMLPKYSLFLLIGFIALAILEMGLEKRLQKALREYQMEQKRLKKKAERGQYPKSKKKKKKKKK